MIMVHTHTHLHTHMYTYDHGAARVILIHPHQSLPLRTSMHMGVWVGVSGGWVHAHVCACTQIVRKLTSIFFTDGAHGQLARIIMLETRMAPDWEPLLSFSPADTAPATSSHVTSPSCDTCTFCNQQDRWYGGSTRTNTSRPLVRPTHGPPPAHTSGLR